MKNLLRLLLKTQHQRNRSGPAQTEKGMTLVELLVGSIMAFLIITPMLAFVVDMLNTDRREQVKSNTEQDIQAAVDFISQDLSQAIYIYDNAGITAIRATDQLPPPPDKTTGSPILVFWKRQQIKNSVPINNSIKPNECDTNPGKCNDTYVLSLVAYYQIKDTTNSIWCQPSGAVVNCPTRIARYEIRDGVRNPYAIATDENFPYYNLSDTKDTQQPDPAFNKAFELTEPTKNVTIATELGNKKSGGKNPEVLVNYIDHTKVSLAGAQCKTALGNPTDPKDATKFLDETTLRVTDSPTAIDTNSFYACVDTDKNIARVTIRGNSLRRLQDSNVASSTENSAFFPTATVQVQGLGARGK
ncbi:hormogonium polysaccharide secretion pseudopilin HpsC [Lyngbya sp. CCAP 1446/10]|uniref:hormogonium polysaccharide secretion pseudopilin HpsC n=1 Tax=Lyngbya sp. CCAP 1446/10 TaxID=439293 RepID=UPI002237297A|nr:hormogonium polysaccharide secretion pseudopilin HpsC [Lyngbya sp. CCAP 1446/10]MCW6052137.1 hormogonium polysaccharide secretion pseudopilin HpsC [Lyngbya sp. CCAP 1446/10]